MLANISNAPKYVRDNLIFFLNNMDVIVLKTSEVGIIIYFLCFGIVGFTSLRNQLLQSLIIKKKLRKRRKPLLSHIRQE